MPTAYTVTQSQKHYFLMAYITVYVVRRLVASPGGRIVVRAGFAIASDSGLGRRSRLQGKLLGDPEGYRRREGGSHV